MAVSKFQLHLPNIVFRLVRAPNLAPNQVAFRIPQRLSKVDIWEYLTKIYQVPIHKIATMNYNGRKTFSGRGGSIKTTKFKKTIVTLSAQEAERMHGSTAEATFSWPSEPPSDELDKIRLPARRSTENRGKNSMRKLFNTRFTRPAQDKTESEKRTAM